MSIVLNPFVKWAQDRNAVYLTAELSNAVVNVLDVQEKSLNFEACGIGAQGENIYSLDLSFYEEVDPKLTKYKTNDRCVTIALKKKEGKYWDRLLVDKKKPGWLKIDFDRWRGEDESEEEEMMNEITKISVEQRKKEMESQLDSHVREAEEEVKQFLIKGYLSIYNIIQGIAFFYITFYVVIKLFYRGKDAVPTIYDSVSDLLATCQIVSFLEFINAAFKLVHTGFFAPLSQSVGRFFVLFLAITPHEELQKSVLVVVLFLTWSLSENVRYPFYFFQTIGYCPKWLLWLRYTAWIPLYPLGLIMEGILIYQAANLFDVSKRWSLSLKLAGNIIIPFSFFLRMYMIFLVIGGMYLLRHMWRLRVKKYGRGARRKLKSTKKD
ncbi:very-long-chain (3R)-3-hydroxyacyl-CoA dehydratase 3-like [Xenia sp. Carnegie-2017]|uniref:very-long-chain (3R)-3-hydroxyacyl-CoA dehydratase 3-like n=1 Tax=Xenia sp. Carnegie-2017 TaxID=2897299 RepID=UPI001F0439F9|nr:very-long-chain (3R)-3-hydroxyacyl-CoA dehydratase 3-like [Xenia sp. Carnegie-2017]